MKNSTTIQKKLAEQLRKQDPDLTIRWNEDRGVAAVASGRIFDWKKGESAEDMTLRFLTELGALFGPPGVLKNCEVVGTEKRKGGDIRTRVMQKAEGLPIYGATLLLFANHKRGVYRVQSGMYRKVEVPPATFGAREVNFEVRAEKLPDRLRKRLEAKPEGKSFARTKIVPAGLMADSSEGVIFPLTTPPKLWLYPTKHGLRQAFRVSAYQPVKWTDASGQTFETVDEADIVIDARTGRIIEENARLGMAYTDTTGDGLSTLEDDLGTKFTRPLFVVQEDGQDRLLINRTRTPHIITHDAGGSATRTQLVNMFRNDTDISTDADGHWNQTTTSCNATNRAASQQPEADGHYFADQAWQFYNDLGWQGFDNGNWGTHCPIRVGTHSDMDRNAYFWRYIDANGKHWGYVVFYDGECVSNSMTFDFFAGDPAIFAHEYQHAITYFGAQDSAGDPGYLDITGWHRAIHEGLSDLMAGLRTGIWVTPGLWAEGITRNSEPFRRIEFPRSTDTYNGDFYLDHYDDRNTNTGSYNRSTILSHATFLAGQGGVHQRTARAAELIPVLSAGRQKIAEIFHYAVTNYFDTIPANTTGGHTMIDAARFVLDAAEDVTGTKRSCAYVMLRRAFYAVGLYPFDDNYTAQTYGGEACMLPWTNSWRHSQPYLDFPAHWWRSPDLFINNGNGVEYDAVVGQENDLFARIRNIGDQALENVKVRFYFRAHGTNLPTSSTQWKECKDQAGIACVLDIPLLAAGSMNFTDPANPLSNQSVKWYLDPTEIVDGLHHFCLRAVIECTAANHDHDCPCHVQSNISYSQLDWGQTIAFPFVVANREERAILLDLEVEHTLPRGFELEFKGWNPRRKTRLLPGEERQVTVKGKMPDRAPTLIPPPFDGEIVGEVVGHDITEKFHGTLGDVRTLRTRIERSQPRNMVTIEGMLSSSIGKKRRINGRFTGELDRKTGVLKGTLKGDIYGARYRTIRGAKLRLGGVLAPMRVVNITQLVDQKPVGGISVQLKPPRLRFQLELGDKV